MPEEEVKIHVRSEADNRALEATEAKIKELYQLAARYEAKGIPEAAKSVRAEARDLEKDVARFKREQHLSEKEITREREKQAAHGRADATHRQTFGSARVIGDALDMATGQQGWVMRAMIARQLPHMLGAMMGPLALGTGAVAALAAVHYKGWRESQRDESEQIQLRQERAGADFQRQRQRGVFGSSGALVQGSLAAEEEIHAREQKREELEFKKRDNWRGLIDRWTGMNLSAGIIWKTEGQRAVDQNEREIARLKKKQEDDKQAAQEKFLSEEGGLGLEALRQRSRRTQSGQREAFMSEYLAKAVQTKKHYAIEGATPEQQNEAAKLDMMNSLRERQIAAGSGLVNARSGAGDIAAAARWGGRVTPGEGEMVMRLDRILGRMDEQTKAQKHVDQHIP